jgi:hypothetical protein
MSARRIERRLISGAAARPDGGVSEGKKKLPDEQINPGKIYIPACVNKPELKKTHLFGAERHLHPLHPVGAGHMTGIPMASDQHDNSESINI